MLSLIEDVVSFGLSFVALLLPVLAALIVAAPHLKGTIIGVGAVLLVIVTAAVIWVAKVSEETPKVLRA